MQSHLLLDTKIAPIYQVSHHKQEHYVVITSLILAIKQSTYDLLVVLIDPLISLLTVLHSLNLSHL